MVRVLRHIAQLATLLTACLALPPIGFAQGEDTSQPTTTAPAAEEAAAQPVAVPILKGEPAPFDGIILNEPKAMEMQRGVIDLTECRGLVDAKSSALATLESDLAQAKQDVQTCQSAQNWTKSFWWGVATGVAASAALAVGAYKVLK